MVAFALLATIISGNHEQMCAILCVLFSAMLLWGVLEKERKEYLITVGLQWTLSIIQLVIILTCKGNQVRKIQEIDRWMPEYVSLTLFDKISMGITDTVNGIMGRQEDLLTLLLCIVICCAVFKKTKQSAHRAAAMIPLIFIIGIRYLKAAFVSTWPALENIFNGMPLIKQNEIASAGTNIWLSLIIYFLICGILIFYLCYISDNVKQRMFYLIMLGSGVATRIAVGLSPSIYVSGIRTFAFLYFIILICTVHIVFSNRLYEEKWFRTFQIIVCAGVFFNVADILNRIV